MYYPPLFTSVRPYDPRPNPLGAQLDVPVVGTGRENPLDLSVKTIRQTPDSTAEAEDLLMLDHRKLASLAASHSLSAMGRQLNPASALLDPALFRLTYGAAAAEAAAGSCSHAAMIPGLTAPFCYDRATGVAVPTSLAGHQLMNSFLQQQQQQQQRERCLEQQHQALLAARTTAQQAAVAAAAFMDPSTLPLHLRGGLSQRDAAVALAATRGLYAPALPTPMVLPAFSLYTDDKGAFTSLRNSSTDKAYLNGSATNALEAARFAEHLQRLREQHLQQAAGKCSNTCCSSSPLSGLGQPTVPCACCIQSPSQPGLCARSAIGGCMKDTTSADTKVCNTNCDYMQSGLTYLHRPTAATAAPTDLRLSAPGYTTAESSSIQREDQKPLFQPSSVWSSGVPSVPAGKTAFSVPKKKEGKESSHKENIPKCIPPVSKDSNSQLNDKDRITPQECKPKFPVKTECMKKEEKEVIVIGEECPQRRTIPEKYTPPKPSLPKPSHHSYYINSSGAVTTVTTATPTVPTKCEGGTIPITKVPPPVLELAKSSESSYTTERLHDVQNSVHSPQGPPPLIAAPSGTNIGYISANNKPYPVTLDPSLRLPLPVTPYTNPAKDFAEKTPCVEPSKPPPTVKSPKKELAASQGGVLPKNLIKEEVKKHINSVHSLPKPIPHVPSSTHHLPSAHYSSHYHPPSHLMHMTQQHPVWTTLPSPAMITQPQATPTVTTPTSSSQSSVQQHQQETPVTTTIKKEPEYLENNVNVLQSLLVRPGSEASATSLPSSAPVVASGAFTPVVGPFDYHQLHRHVGIQQRQIDSVTSVSAPIEKREPDNNNQVIDASTKSCSKKKSTTDSIELSPKPIVSSSEKKRMTCEEYPKSSYVFPRTSYAHASGHYIHSPHSPYTFIPESGSFNNQVQDCKVEEKPLNLNCSAVHQTTLPPVQPDNKTCYLGLPNVQNIWSDVASDQQHQQQYQQHPYLPQPQYHQQPYQQEQRKENDADRMAKSRAKRRLRKKLLTRLLRRKKLLVSSSAEEEKAIALRHTRRLLSQLKLQSRHRRMLYKLHITRRKKLRLQLAQRRLVKNKKTVVYRIRSGALTKRIKKTSSDVKHVAVPKTQSVQSSPLTVPVEMKKLMVNKALGETILHKAARLGYPEVVVYCLETSCCNVNARDNAGYTPLHECCSRGHLDIARALLQYGADVNASAAGGIRPLHDAIENDHVEIVRLLLCYGADPSIATYSGLAPLKLAHSPAMSEFLQGFLADISGEMTSRPHLPWRFWGSASCLDPDDNGYDIFSGVPSDPEDNGEGKDDFLFEAV